MSVPGRRESFFDRSLSIRIEERPSARLLRSPRDYPLKAWECGVCGCTELYVTTSQEVLESESRARQAPQESPSATLVGSADARRREVLMLLVILAGLIAVGLGLLVLWVVHISG